MDFEDFNFFLLLLSIYVYPDKGYLTNDVI